jgi:branched-chain amino acid:cation transporter, LIVCS family
LKHTKQTLVTAFALFSLFFGAGNLILPPFLGYQSGSDWYWVTFGFVCSAVIIPILAIYGYARIQGSLVDFARNMGSKWALIYASLIYLIAITLPAPRTASVTYEMAIAPYGVVPSWLSSAIYFMWVLVFVLNRSKILNLIGKYLTPLIVLLLLAVIIIGLGMDQPEQISSLYDNNWVAGFLEGYQTFDAIGGVVVGGVLVISLALQVNLSYEQKRSIIGKAGLWAGIGLFTMYAGLIALGAHFGAISISTRTELLIFLSASTLGSLGTAFLSILVALACFTTAVGIIAGTADFVKGISGNSKTAYTLSAVISAIIGALIGHFKVQFIIDIALPVLMFIYPITIVLILLNALPTKYRSKEVVQWVVGITFIFSLPDAIRFFIAEEWISTLLTWIPFSEHNLGWFLPALITFISLQLLRKKHGINTPSA